MRKNFKKAYLLFPMTLLVALFLAMMPGTAFAATATPAVAATPLSTQAGYTNAWVHVRTGTNTGSAIVTTYAPNTHVTIYASVSGQNVYGNSSTWYRISSITSAPLYIYGDLVTLTSGTPPPPPSAQGKVIVVSLSKSAEFAYENGRLVFQALVITGRSSLPTPLGTYHVFLKLSPTTFYSPWPYGSPYWYPPTHINYALEFRAGGYFLHDTWWHTVYGPGTNNWHYDPVYGWQWGTHGCVGMPLSAAAWLYNWAPIGTTVQVIP